MGHHLVRMACLRQHSFGQQVRTERVVINGRPEHDIDDCGDNDKSVTNIKKDDNLYMRHSKSQILRVYCQFRSPTTSLRWKIPAYISNTETWYTDSHTITFRLSMRPPFETFLVVEWLYDNQFHPFMPFG